MPLILPLAIAYILVGHSQEAAPKATAVEEAVTLSGPIQPGRCRVTLDLDGHPRLFLIDTGLEHSYIRPDVKLNVLAKNPKAQLSVGPASIAVSSLTTPESTLYQEVPAVAGVVGLDVLSKIVFGIDYKNRKLTVWPANTKDPGKDWLLEDPKSQEPINIPLDIEEGSNVPFVATEYGTCELDTGATITLLPKGAANSTSVISTNVTENLELFDGTAGHANQAIANELEIGHESFFCSPVLVGDQVDVGVFAPSVLGSRVLFDLPNHRITSAGPRRETADAEYALTTLFHTSVQARNGHLYLLARGPAMDKATDPWTKLVSINGHKADDLLRLFLKKDTQACIIMLHAYNAMPAGCKVVVDHAGKQTTITMSPFLSRPG